MEDICQKIIKFDVDSFMSRFEVAQVFEYQTICSEDSNFYSPYFIGISAYGQKIVLTPVDSGFTLEVTLGHFPIVSLPDELNLRSNIFDHFKDQMIFISIGNHKIIVSYNTYVDITCTNNLNSELSSIAETLLELSKFLLSQQNFEPYTAISKGD